MIVPWEDRYWEQLTTQLVVHADLEIMSCADRSDSDEKNKWMEGRRGKSRYHESDENLNTHTLNCLPQESLITAAHSISLPASCEVVLTAFDF